MAKYNYDKSVLKGLGTGPFLNEVKLRNEKIEEAPDSMPVSIFNENRLAASLHPDKQYAVVTDIKDFGYAKTFVLTPDEEAGCTSFAYFRAGQYVSVTMEIGSAIVNKPYTLCCAPKDALGTENTSYRLTISHSQDGFASEYILDNWQVGTKVTLSGPLGQFYYTHLRDAGNVVALAGGSGITPFYAMACAIADGTEDFNLTILYGSRKKDAILLKDELDQVAEASQGKVKVIHVLSEDSAEGFEQGFITAEMIQKYAPADDYSVFVCGPKAMYAAMDTELEKLALPRRRIRMEVPGEYGDPTEDEAYPKDTVGKTYQVTVVIRDEKQTVPCKAEQSLLSAMEQAGIKAPSHCRSGECSFCRSLLQDGQVYIPASVDERRMADIKFNWIHPCISYPLSDVTLVLAV